MNYAIRKAVSADIYAIQALLTKLYRKEHEEFDSTLDPAYATSLRGEEFLRNRIEDDTHGFCLVAEDAGNIIGCFIGGVHMSESYRFQNVIAEGENVFVESAYRSNGIGTEFLRLFEEWCKEKGVTRMRLVASSRNGRALELYKKVGFEIFDVMLEKDVRE